MVKLIFQGLLGRCDCERIGLGGIIKHINKKYNNNNNDINLINLIGAKRLIYNYTTTARSKYNNVWAQPLIIIYRKCFN